MPERTRGVLNAPEPTTIPELWSYLGMVNYYAQSLPSLAAVLEPLHVLLRKGAQWNWTERQARAFQHTKQLLCSADVLIHFDPKLPILIECDASPYGVGAVLSHQLPQGGARPVAYASRTLMEAERNYAQFDREALAVVLGYATFITMSLANSSPCLQTIVRCWEYLERARPYPRWCLVE